MKQLSAKIIKDKILQNYIEYQYLFAEFQSNFLTGLHSRYQSIENGNLVLYFEKQTHQEILRQKDYDLEFNISYENFWENHGVVNPRKISLKQIAKSTSLPKETTRRKVLLLTKQKVLNKKNKNIGWLPNEQYKRSYNLFVEKEIQDVAKLINFVCQKLNYSISNETITEELKKNFSFYWLHYLRTQLEYLRLWSKQLNDLELCLIFLQIANLICSKAKEMEISHKDIYQDPSLLKEFVKISISATSISEVTKIPRATCVRKLDILIGLKIVSQDKISKRYYIMPDTFSGSLISEKITENVVKTFSEFFFIILRTIFSKT
tara:strand:+ start:176 stop:1135 length:960 start_codon:yes stop_codon:yes gene_type:complete